MFTRLWFRIVAFGALILLLLLYPNVGNDYDIWWHLRYGQHFVENCAWRLDHTVFSWTPTDVSWRYVTWLADIILYATYRIGGFALLNVLQWLLLFTTAFLIDITARRCAVKASKWVRLTILFCAGIAINPVAVYVKPELFTLFFFTLILAVFFESKRTRRHWFYCYPPLFLLWVNMHGGFINGVALLMLLWLAEGLAVWRSSPAALSRRQWQHFTLALMLTSAALCVNPYGLWYPLGMLQDLYDMRWASHIRAITAYAAVLPHLFLCKGAFRVTNTAWMLLYMGCTALIASIHTYRRCRFFDLALSTALIVFFVFALTMLRASIYFVVLWAYALAVLNQHSGFLNKPARHIFDVLPRCVPILFVFIIVYQTLAVNTSDSWFGSRLENWVPINETAAIKKHNMPAPVFNDYLTGGYLLWGLYPDYKAFIDPRYGPYEATGVWDDYLQLIRAANMRDAWFDLTAKYRCNTAIIRIGLHPRLLDTLLASPTWHLVYFDKVAAVFVQGAQAERIRVACRAEMSPEKFATLNNPVTLFHVFCLYRNYDRLAAKRIYEIYKENIRGCYQGRANHLQRMAHLLSS